MGIHYVNIRVYSTRVTRWQVAALQSICNSTVCDKAVQLETINYSAVVDIFVLENLAAVTVLVLKIMIF